MDKYFTKGDVLDVRVEKVVPRGFGLAFAENLTVLVPLAAPGDLLRVKIGDIKKRMAFAEIVDVLKPGPKRVTPVCGLFGICGGCDFQHLAYSAQLEAKVGIIRDCLHRIGKIEFDGEIPIVASPDQFEYRSRARWHVDKEKRSLGFFKRDSHEVIDISSCPVLTPGMTSTLDYLRISLDWDAFQTPSPEIEAASGEGGRISTWSGELGEEAAEISIDIGGETYFYSAETFFQANRFLVEKLIETAIGDASGDIALDLYSGVGLFSLPLARRFTKVLAVEESAPAVELAKKNAANAGLKNIEFRQRAVTRSIAKNQMKRPTFILVDPPRSGTEKGVIEKIAALRAEHISYVSCEPSILARDLRTLVDHGYNLDSITALDMFPQTHHVETVAHLTRRS